MARKGLYPYDYMNSFDRFEEEQPPSKNDFFSELNNEHISDEDYEHVLEVWEKMGVKNMGDYYDLYLSLMCLY